MLEKQEQRENAKKCMHAGNKCSYLFDLYRIARNMCENILEVRVKRGGKVEGSELVVQVKAEVKRKKKRINLHKMRKKYTHVRITWFSNPCTHRNDNRRNTDLTVSFGCKGEV